MIFHKMHGIGNDYLYVDCIGESANVARLDDRARAGLARKMSDRHFGAGADGLILILPSKSADCRMRMFNSDGSEAEMCGNGIRCLAKYAFDHALTKSNPLRVQTPRGVLTLDLHLFAGKVDRVTVNMGAPVLLLPEIPVDASKLITTPRHAEYRIPIPASSELIHATFVSMGNPHAVIFTADVQAIDLPHLGPILENHHAFPRRINVHWAQIVSSKEVIIRHWERGSGITLACGTGACAVCAAGVLTNRTQPNILAHLPGGDLFLEWRASDNNLYLTGPATEVFTGDWPD
jgi:diaminopimelate epimerase